MRIFPPLLSLLVATPALATGPIDVRTAQATAAGSAAAAHADDNTALSVNPAAMGLSRRYALGGAGSFWDGRDWRFAVHAVDSQTNPGVAIGLSYQRWRTTGALSDDELPGWIVAGDDIPSYRRFDVITAGMAVPLADNRFSIGVNGSVVIMQHAVLGSVTSGDLDVGLAGRPTEKWGVGVALRNALPQFVVTDEPLALVAGTRYAWKPHTAVALDVDVPLTAVDGVPVSIRGGAEWGDDIRHLGLGYRFEGPDEEHWITVGAGLWNDPQDSDTNTRAGIHYAAEIPLHALNADQKRGYAITHTLSFTIQPGRSLSGDPLDRAGPR